MNITELIAKLRCVGQNAKLAHEAADALLAQQVCIEKMREALDVIAYSACGEESHQYIAATALVLQPDLSALREHDAEIERRVLANAKVRIPTDVMEQAFAREYDRGYAAGKAAAERIRKGGAA